MVVMMRVRCLVTPPASQLHHQPVPPQDLDECVPSGHTARRLEQVFDDAIQFIPAKAGVIFPVRFRLLYYQRLYRILCERLLVIPLVIGLSAVTKQFTESLQRNLRRTLVKQTYCLVPAFFLMEMFRFCSATSIIFSYAFALKLAISSAS